MNTLTTIAWYVATSPDSQKLLCIPVIIKTFIQHELGEW